MISLIIDWKKTISDNGEPESEKILNFPSDLSPKVPLTVF